MDESVKTQEVADPVNDTQEVETQEKPQEEGVKEAAPAAQPRDFEKDAAFAKMRREADQAKRDADRLKAALKRFDLKGENAEDLADQAEAYHTGRSIDQVRQDRVERERLLQLEEENKLLKERESERVFQDDLGKIKALYPDMPIKSVFDLGEEFIKLRANGIDAVIAYEAIKAKEVKETVPKPPSTGSAKDSGKAPREYFTSDEIDKLSPKDLDNPKILEKALKSLRRK